MTHTCPHDTELRLLHLEQAFIVLLERVAVLERAQSLGARDHEQLAASVAALTGLPKRVDRLEQFRIGGRLRRPEDAG